MFSEKALRLHGGSAVENIKQFLEVIEQKNARINALLHVNREEALEQAVAVDKKIKQKKAGKLAGLAIVVKANISVLDMPVNCASRTLENYKGTFDADVIKRIRQEDGIIIGIANMDEFACGSSGETSAFGPTDNPAAPGLIPGGSSSGSAAAVAAGMCDLALGSDTGGSIRNPASHCGVVGIKPSYGRVSRFGLIDLSMSLDQIGPLSRDVEGSALLLEAISGQSKYDATTSPAAVPAYSKLKEPRKMRIGLSEDFEKMCTDPRIYKKIAAAAENLAERTDSHIVPVRLTHTNLAIQTYYPLVYVEFFSGTRKFDGRKYGKKIEESCGEEVLRRILGGREISKSEYEGKYYRKALAVKKLIQQDFEQAFTKADVIATPTTPLLPHKIGTSIQDPQIMYAYDAFTIPANLAGICAGVIPCARIEDIPAGLQLMAPAFQEERLLGALKSIESWQRPEENQQPKEKKQRKQEAR